MGVGGRRTPLIPRLMGYRHIVHVGADVMFTQFSEQHSTIFWSNMVHIEMKGAAPFWAEVTGQEFRGQRFKVTTGNLTALGDPGVKIAHLAQRSEEHTSELQSRENLVC